MYSFENYHYLIFLHSTYYIILFGDLNVTVTASEKQQSLPPATPGPLKGPSGESQRINCYSFQGGFLRGRVKCYFIYFSCIISVISQ